MIEIPNVETLLAPLAPLPWASARSKLLAESYGCFDRVASLGFMARFGTCLSSSPAVIIPSMRAYPERFPLTTIVKWAAGLHDLSPDDEGVDEIEAEFRAEAGLVASEIAAMLPSRAGEPEAFASTARAVCHRREDLQGVCVVLILAGRRNVMKPLAELDEQAKGTIPDIQQHKDQITKGSELIPAVAAFNPEVWWSLVEGSQ